MDLLKKLWLEVREKPLLVAVIRIVVLYVFA